MKLGSITSDIRNNFCATFLLNFLDYFFPLGEAAAFCLLTSCGPLRCGLLRYFYHFVGQRIACTIAGEVVLLFTSPGPEWSWRTFCLDGHHRRTNQHPGHKGRCGLSCENGSWVT
jgi:hypothetical protein